MNRLKRKEIADFRKNRMEEIVICPLCKVKLDFRSHLDHNHKNGQIRDVLHAGCNRALGKLERALQMTPDPIEFLNNVGAYIIQHTSTPSGLYHPTWKTEEEKKELRNKRARRKRKWQKYLDKRVVLK